MSKRNKQFESDPILAEARPAWIEELKPHQVNTKLATLIQFYVFNSPCRVSSWGRKSMEDYGWRSGYWNSKYFHELIFNAAELDEFHQCETLTAFKKLWPDIYNFEFSQKEFAYFVAAGEENQLMNLFHRIRNAFSHGRFRINGEYFFFEDVEEGKQGIKVKARICLKQNTLEAWMTIIRCENEKAKAVRDKMGKR